MMILIDVVEIVNSNLAYIAAINTPKKIAVYIDDSFGVENFTEQKQLLNAFASRHPTEKKLIHLVFSNSPGENFSTEEWKVIIQYSLGALGYDESAYVAMRHVGDIDHVHVSLSRVDVDGLLLSSSFDRLKCVRLARELERDLGLKEVKIEDRNERSYSRAEFQSIRHGFKTELSELRDKLDTILASTQITNWSIFRDACELTGIDFKIHERNGEPCGISYKHGIYPSSGSGLGPKYKYRSILSAFESNNQAKSMGFQQNHSQQSHEGNVEKQMQSGTSKRLDGQAQFDNFISSIVKKSNDYNSFSSNLLKYGLKVYEWDDHSNELTFKKDNQPVQYSSYNETLAEWVRLHLELLRLKQEKDQRINEEHEANEFLRKKGEQMDEMISDSSRGFGMNR